MRMCLAALLAILVVAAPLAAQPATYRVVNVDADDVLNVRRTPSPTSAFHHRAVVTTGSSASNHRPS